MRPTTDPFIRFARKVVFVGDCWVWIAHTSKGHGRFMDYGNRFVQAHRFSYELFRGPIPTGLTLDHLCRNRACVNPVHLEPATNKENILRGLVPIPCTHGLRAIHHCHICKKQYYSMAERRRRKAVRSHGEAVSA